MEKFYIIREESINCLTNQFVQKIRVRWNVTKQNSKRFLEIMLVSKPYVSKLVT